MTPTCPACRAELPADARFCPACGTRLEVSGPEATERKVVTTLFADLVGFTALGERHDPEDIDAALRGFYGLARTIVERFGGTVEKFIGDAVVGLFGVPKAHEDDAERAVRAALELVAHLHELPPVGDDDLQVRCAVNTGPAVVRLDARPETGEGVLVGDAVNTCARLLSEAPAMGVVAGERTQRLSARAIAFEELPAVTAKGKREPVLRWLARGQRAQRGMSASSLAETPMVGREVELATLDALLAKAIAASAPQFVLVSGEAGIGKSRLIGELYRIIDERPGFFVQWRQGHCPPYGEDLTFWALREIVSSHVGVVRSDSAEAIERKLDAAFGDAPDVATLLERLRPVVGLQTQQTASDDGYTVWESALEAIAASRPTVLVVEDLHWASRPMLDFLSRYTTRAPALPLLVVITARPEFLETHPDMLAPSAHVTRLPLRTLAPDEIRRMAAALPGSDEPAMVDALVESCGGNPLFAEELARHLAESGLEAPGGGPQRPSDHTGTESISALIEARLDVLPPEERNLLADASVVGRVFWPGALAAIGGGDPISIQTSLDTLEAHEFLRRAPESLQPGEIEYAFWHALTRDAAYGRLPRAARALKHAAVADWMAQTSRSAGPAADLIAHHRWTAVELAGAAGLPDEAARLRGPAVEALVTAGDLALSLDIASAERSLSRAVSLLTDEDPQRPAVLTRWAEASAQSGQLEASAEAFLEAIAGLNDQGDARGASAAMTGLSRVLLELGDPRAEHFSEASVSAAESAGPSLELVRALELRAFFYEMDENRDAELGCTDRVLALCRELGRPPSPRALMRRGLAHCIGGDSTLALVDLARAVELAAQGGAAAELSAAYSCQALGVLIFEGPARSREVNEAGLQSARERNDRLGIVFLEESLFDGWLFGGSWDEALAAWPAVESRLRAQNQVYSLSNVANTVGLILALRGAAALSGEARLLEMLRQQSTDAEEKSSLIAGSVVLHAMGETRAATRLLRRLVSGGPSLGGAPGLALMWPLVLRTGLALGDDRLIDQLVSSVPRTVQALPHTIESILGLTREHKGDPEAAAAHFKRAAEVWSALDFPLEAAEASFGLGRCLARCGSRSEAKTALEAAYATFEGLGASPLMAATAAALKDCTAS